MRYFSVIKSVFVQGKGAAAKDPFLSYFRTGSSLFCKFKADANQR